jgi:hypothetical protein
LVRTAHAAMGDVPPQGHGPEGLLNHQMMLRLVK